MNASITLSTGAVTVSTGALLPREVVNVARHLAPVELSAESLAAMEESRAVIDALVTDTVPHYGVSTGFGALATKQIPIELRAQLQRSLIRSHAASSGAEVSREVIRGLMLNRLSTMATGRTGVRPVVARTYAALLNAQITPVVGEYGSLGCSGDLAPLSHCALAVMGEGKVRNAAGELVDAVRGPRRGRHRARGAGRKGRPGADQRHRRHARHAADGRRPTCATWSASPTSPPP